MAVAGAVDEASEAVVVVEGLLGFEGFLKFERFLGFWRVGISWD